MKNDRELTTTLENILSLISVADDYGFHQSVLLDAFADMMDRKLSEDEIQAYAASVLLDPDYGEADYDSIIEVLTEFKDRYIRED